MKTSTDHSTPITSARAREIVENHYRAKIHAQLGALRKRLTELSSPPYAIQWLKRLKLQKKIARLEGELLQPVLFQKIAVGGGSKRSRPGRRLTNVS